MALIEGKDYVFAPNGTYVWNGINYVTVVGTKDRLFLVTKENISGAGSRVEEIRTTFGGLKPEDALRKLFAAPEMTLEKLEGILREMVGGDEKFYLEIPQLAEFKVKNSFFSRGIYWKHPGDRGYSGLGVSGKNYVQAIQNFYER